MSQEELDPFTEGDPKISSDHVVEVKTTRPSMNPKRTKGAGHLEYSVDSFKSNSTLLPDNPVREQVHKAINLSAGTITSRSPAEKLNRSFNSSAIFRGRTSTRRSSKTKQSLLDIEESKDIADRLNAITSKIEDNTHSRQPVEETSIMVNNELITKHVYQLRSVDHGGMLTQRTEDGKYNFIVAKGRTFNHMSSKPCQDCIAFASWNNFECVAVCDGHGRTGEEVAWQVSNALPGRILGHISDSKQKNPDMSDQELFETSTTPETISRLFHECDDEVVWTKDLTNFRWVKIIGGEFKGLMAQVCHTSLDANVLLPPTARGDEEDIPVCVFINGERKFRKPSKFKPFKSTWTAPNRQMELPIEQQFIKRKYLLCEREFYGGGTCLIFIRNKVTNQFRFATAGDSRLLYVPPKLTEYPEDETALKIRGRAYNRRSRLSCFSGSSAADTIPAILSVEHNIHDQREYDRLSRDHAGCFIVGDGVTSEAMEGYFYSNALFPYTGGLTPTRGFGDRLYFGSGYTCEPEVSQVYTFEEGGIILGGSDGIFDDAVWGPEICGLVYEVKKLKKEKLSGEEMIKRIQEETTRKCKDWNLFRVDDISLFSLT